MDYKENYLRWLNSDKLTNSEKEELKNLDEKEIQDRFYRDLEFGTGGMRGVMGVGTNRMNSIIIKKATLGFARYLLKYEENAKERGVVIAHDNRKNHDVFQQAVSDVLTSLGIKVYMFDMLRTTPELSFAIRYLKACGGINITASHNPKEYNGYKIYNADGNQLILEQSNKVMEEIGFIEDELAIETTPNKDLEIICGKDVDRAYYDMVEAISLRKDMDKSNIKVVYTPQHGTGYEAATCVLNELGYNIIEVKEQCIHLDDFANTKSANPEEKVAYELAIEYANKNDADIIIANDPDCDRVGLVSFDENRNPIYMTGNQTGACLLEYIFSTKKEFNALNSNGIIYNTIVSSPLGAKIAASYGVDCEATLTGFKYIGDKIKKSIENNGKEFLFGYEESYGYLMDSNVRDKDGIQADIMICEMVSYYKHQGYRIHEFYEKIQQKYGFYLESLHSFYARGMEGGAKIKQIMEDLRNASLKEIEGNKVEYVEDYLTLKRTYLKDNHQIDLDYENSNVLRYVFEDGSFVAIRPSGTEPKIKFYFDITGKTKEEVKTNHDKVKAYMLTFLD